MADIRPGDAVVVTGKVRAILFQAGKPTEYVIALSNDQSFGAYDEDIGQVDAKEDTSIHELPQDC